MAENGSPAFRRVQAQFSAHLRDPEHCPPPSGLDPERLAIYSDAVFANIEGLLSDNFPLLRRYLDDDAWRQLVRDFLSGHRSAEMRFIRYPLQFIRYLESRDDLRERLPFVDELADFEWRETDVCGDETEVSLTGIERDGDLLTGAPVLNPVHRVLRYGWAVHLLGETQEPGATPEQRDCHLVVFRNLEQRFDCVELNPVSARLVSLLEESPAASGREHLTRIAWELKHPDADAVIAGGLDILERMRARELILGSRTA